MLSKWDDYPVHQAADILLPIAAKVDRDLNPPPMATPTPTPTPR